MLNRRERYKILKFYKFCCAAGFLPNHVNLSTWDLEVPSTANQWISAVSYCIYILHVLYKVVSLAYVYIFVPDIQLHQLILHVVLATATAVYAWWYYVAYIADPTLFATFFKHTLLGNIGGPAHPGNRLNRGWTTGKRTYSIADVITLSLPYAIPMGMPFIAAVYIYDPSMRLLVYTILPGYLQNRVTFGLCLIEEIRLILTSYAIVVPMMQLQVMSFDLVSNHLRLLIQNGMQRTTASVVKSLRSLQLYVRMLNKVNSYMIFTWKLLSISVCIIAGYSAIAHFDEYPVFGCMYYVMFFEVALIYMSLYGQAFRVPKLFDQARGSALLYMRGNRSDLQARVFKRQILSVPHTGIKVGQFHYMERASIIIFIDFVLKNIVSMLVAYG